MGNKFKDDIVSALNASPCSYCGGNHRTFKWYMDLKRIYHRTAGEDRVEIVKEIGEMLYSGHASFSDVVLSRLVFFISSLDIAQLEQYVKDLHDVHPRSHELPLRHGFDLYASNRSFHMMGGYFEPPECNF